MQELRQFADILLVAGATVMQRATRRHLPEKSEDRAL